MRVTGGDARGVTLIAPRGLDTRPTTDRVREAIFSILFSMDADLERVLDLYAGSGALAIEALSRGAAAADLVERAPAACAAIRRNLAAARVTERAHLYCAEAGRTLARLTGPYTLVFLDPPYDDPGVTAVLDTLAASGLVADKGTIVLEHGRRRPPPERVGRFALESDRRYGDTGVAFFR